MRRSRSAGRQGRAWVSALALCAFFLAATPSASADIEFCPPGSGAAQCASPQGIALDHETGRLYVADRNNNRVNVFAEDGDFLFAFGWGVVASGPGDEPRNERQSVTVSATGGTFRLAPLGDPFVTDTGKPNHPLDPTAPIPFDASATAVREALEKIGGIEPGDIAVSGSAGGPWTVEFQGAYADTEMIQMQGLSEGLSGGAGTVTVATVQEGANFEICDPGAGDVCRAGQSGPDAGQMAPNSIAVDNDAGSPSQHGVYVGESFRNRYRIEKGGGGSLTIELRNFRVQSFDPTGEFVWMIGEGLDKSDGGDLCSKAELHACGAGSESEATGGFNLRSSVGVGPGGIVHVLDNLGAFGGLIFDHRLQRFQPDGMQIDDCVLAEDLGRANELAVDSGGNSWVANQLTGRSVRKYDPSCSLDFLAEDSDRDHVGIAFDEADRLFALQTQDRDKAGASRTQAVTAYEPDGEITRRFGYDRLPSLIEAIAPRGNGEGGIFLSSNTASNPSGITRLDFPPPTPTLPPPGPIVLPSSLEAAEVGPTKATLVTEVNPEGKETKVHFEFVDEATYLKDIEELGPGHGFDNAEETPDESLGIEDFGLKSFSDPIGCPDPATEVEEPGNDCLIPETPYRWRVIATNEDGGGEGTLEGPPFETTNSLEFRGAYVTQVGTDTARLHTEVHPHAVPATGHFEYVTEAAYLKDIEGGGDGFAAAVKAPNVDEGQAPLDFGAEDDFTTRQVTVFPLAAGTAYRYRIVAVNPLIEPLAGEPQSFTTFAPPETNPGCENDESRIGLGALLPDCRAYEMVSPLDKAGGDIRVLDAPGGRAVLEQGDETGEKLAYGSARAFGDAQSAPITSQYIAQRIAGSRWRTHSINPPRGRSLLPVLQQLNTEVKAFTNDLCQSWLTTFAEAPLAEGGVPGVVNLYRRDDRLCAPEGFEALAPVLELTNPDPVVLGISADGSHTIFAVTNKLTEEASEGPRQLYESVGGELRFVCILPGGAADTDGCTAGSGSEPGGGPKRISNDGERVFWSDNATAEGKLYVRIGGSQTVAVSEEAEDAEGTDKSWFWAATSDGSKAVFTTGGTLYTFSLAGGVTSDPIAEGVIGVMGMSEDASRIYFASKDVLAPGAEAGKANLYLYDAGSASTEFIATLASADLVQTVLSEPFRKQTARVSPDGAHAAFVSVAPLTGYDNKGAESGVATSQVYRYDAETGELLCASCNPSGSRPAGNASIPSFQTPIHAARVLSDDGSRLHFESEDVLAARDTNGAVDVYQWEEPGAGTCTLASSTYSPLNQGCVELVSSGQSPLDSRFVESDPSGEDVFFATGSSLLPQDYGLFDIYDARVGGGLPIPSPPPPGCEGEACQSPAEAPNDPTPASSAFEGAGNVVEPAVKPRCPKGKRRVLRRGKVRCVPKKRHAAKQRRASRNRRAGR